MSRIDQFESAFKSADKPVFRHERAQIRAALAITDVDPAAAQEYQQRVAARLPASLHIQWQWVSGEQFTGVHQLLEIVERARPDLLCVYRNLFIPAAEHPYSLGVYVDVLTQATSVPVLLTPRPERLAVDAPKANECVMAITDHLTGDHHLVSCALLMTEPGGRLLLTHLEDQDTYRRYMDVISKVPSVPTESAAAAIQQQLLKEPEDFIRSCQQVLEQEGWDVHIESIVRMGSHLPDYRRLIEEHDVDLLVLNTKDDDQLAMHGLAYPLAVELREMHLLLL